MWSSPRATQLRLRPIVALTLTAAVSTCGLREVPYGPADPEGNGVSSGGSGAAAGAGSTGEPRSSGAGGSGAGTPSGGGAGGSPVGSGGASGRDAGAGGSNPGGSGGAGASRDAGALGGGSGSGDSGAPISARPLLPPIDINGTMVPGNKVIVFIHFGHSNMAGMGATPTSLKPFFYDTQANLWSYQGAGKFVLAKEQTAPDPDEHGAGPGMAWLRTAAALAPPDYQFVSIARARGGAPSADFMKGGLYYSGFMDRAKQLKGRVVFGGVFIMLGITDRHMPLNQQGGFADRMVKIIADIRADLGEPNLPILHTDYEVTATGTLSVTSDFAMRIRPLILSLPMRITNCAIIPTDMVTLEDDHHFTLAGHKLWSERGVKIMVERGWFPWTK